MKIAFNLLALSLFFSFQSLAIEVDVIGPKQMIIYHTEFDLSEWKDSDLTAGKISILALDEAVRKIKLSYHGSEGGISKINDLGESIEVVSDQEMRAYGWCYDVDGISSDLMPDQQAVTRNAKKITWTYVYAHYLNGNWVSMCTPVN